MYKKAALKILGDAEFVCVKEIPTMIAQALHPIEPGNMNDPDLRHVASETYYLQQITERQQYEYLQQAVRNGKLIVRNRFTRVPVPGPDAVGDWLNSALVIISDLTLYLAQFGIVVVPKTTEPAMKAVETTYSLKDRQKACDTRHGGETWTLNKPKRFQGYNRALYEYLKSALEAGADCPSPHDVLDAFRQNRPPEVDEVLPESLKYQGANGTKEADVNAIRKAISRLVNRQHPNKGD